MKQNKKVKHLEEHKIKRFLNIGFLYLGLDKNQNHKFSWLKFEDYRTYLKFYKKTQQWKCYRDLGEWEDDDNGNFDYFPQVKWISLKPVLLNVLDKILKEIKEEFYYGYMNSIFAGTDINGFQYMRLDDHWKNDTKTNEDVKRDLWKYRYNLPYNNFKLTDRMKRKYEEQNG